MRSFHRGLLVDSFVWLALAAALLALGLVCGGWRW